MTIEFPCHNCLQQLRVPDTSAGKGARCPKCQAVTPVPAVSQGSGFRSQGPETMRPAYPPVQPAPSPSPPAAPPPSANDALFAMLKAATTPQPQPQALPPQPVVPPAMPPLGHSGASPFSAAMPGPAAGFNPYASPAEAYLSPAAVAGAGQRPGLPWEIEGPGVMSWWKTAQLCLTDASHAFRLMRQDGGIGPPLLYAALGLLLGFVGQTIWRLPVMLIEANGGGGGGGGGGFPQGINGALIEIGVGAVITLAMATFGLFFFAAMYHVCLLALGGARHGFETTYRVVAFAHGSIAWLQVVPCVGGCIVLVMLYICLINGLAAAQETTGGKAAASVFLPLGFFLLLGALAIGIVVAVAINA